MGKTPHHEKQTSENQKHPHGRGEDFPEAEGAPQMWETPPRAWGRLLHAAVRRGRRGNTPTGVGKTPASISKKRKMVETPPRAWGRRTGGLDDEFGIGNTPTGVGKTEIPSGAKKCSQKHPHGRGEDFVSLNFVGSSEETPPRAWGRQYERTKTLQNRGNTPTGVGKTVRLSVFHLPRQKHPHGRGEDFGASATATSYMETPPRAWGRQN